MTRPRFLLFAGSRYYPRGGTADIKGWGDDVERLKELYAEHSAKWAREIGGTEDPWGEIVEHASMRAVLETEPDASRCEWRTPEPKELDRLE